MAGSHGTRFGPRLSARVSEQKTPTQPLHSAACRPSAVAELLSARWLALRDCQTAQAELFGREGSVSVTAAQQRSLRDWLELWSREPVEPGTPGDIVGRLLTFNQIARSPWREGDVNVLVAENQGVWLWGRTDQGDFVERENEQEDRGSPYLRTRRPSGSTKQRSSSFRPDSLLTEARTMLRANRPQNYSMPPIHSHVVNGVGPGAGSRCAAAATPWPWSVTTKSTGG